MTPFRDVAASPSSPSIAPGESPLRPPKARSTRETQSLASSVSTLPYRNSVSSLFASTSTPPGSRSISPNGGLASSRILSESVFAGSPSDSPLRDQQQRQQLDDPRQLLLQAYVPHIAVYTSKDTKDLAADKGFSQGLWQILRPFGEKVQGKVTIRDSIGASRVCNDFSIRFVQLGDGIEPSPRSANARRSTEGQAASTSDTAPVLPQSSRTGGDIEAIENLVERHLLHAEAFPFDVTADYLNAKDPSDLDTVSPFYLLYLRRLLSGIPLAPHETFSHPVACIIAISSRNPNPIETLRQLYDDSSIGDKRLPLWVNGQYLRYYVLVHDEERDEISKSMNLFEQMKRHFGLHCHLLRLRSSQCVPTDDDSVKLPTCDWMSATEELAEINYRELREEGVEDNSAYIFESDETAIKTFIREMVTQSVVPSMERCISTWNEQVASKRRGLSGRLLGLSKKWTVFGSGSRASSTPGSSVSTTGSNSNYDAVQGFYQPDSPEALMRKLADYAFMLRDWKLAQSIYDLLRSDFNNDKAWRYHAAANEMAALSTLLASQTISFKVRSEVVDQMLETASYSYLTRCNTAYGAFRCLTLAMELLRLRGGSATDDAARWGSKLLETKIVGRVGDGLIKERVAACYASRKGAGSEGWGSRTRKSAMWNVLAADQWINLGKYVQAERQMSKVRELHRLLGSRENISQFSAANEFLGDLERELQLASISNTDQEGHEIIRNGGTPEIDEESEALDVRTHRKSLIGAAIPPLSSLETAPLQTMSEGAENMAIRDDDFV